MFCIFLPDLVKSIPNAISGAPHHCISPVVTGRTHHISGSSALLFSCCFVGVTKVALVTLLVCTFLYKWHLLEREISPDNKAYGSLISGSLALITNECFSA
jgi:hypothetical protein